jgi:Trypsin-like peptidase domain
MVTRRLLLVASLLTTAISCFVLGVVHARRADVALRVAYDAKLDAIRADIARANPGRAAEATATAGKVPTRTREEAPLSPAGRAGMIAEIKQDLQREMGLMPVHLLRDRRSSFVELYSYDTLGKTNYGTAGYLGRGYFITVKHAVVALKDEDDRPSPRAITSVKVMYHGAEIPARVIDSGDADVEVHSGDWAIIKTRELDLPALRVDTAFAYDFADPVFRLGNDYSKGVILSSGYVGQRTANGLVTCLTDGHPGVSGGGILDQRGDLVGIPIGRMQGDYRFSFILPMRGEMLRKVPAYEPANAVQAVVAEQQQ